MSKKILVVDDDNGILEVIRSILEAAGYQVLTSQNGDFISTLKTQKPEVILLDVLLSGEDGRDIARKIKSKQETEKIPVVMMSAHPDVDKSTRDAGADEFISKPFDIDDLLQVVEKYTRPVN